MSTNKSNRQTVGVFACGGTGANIIHNFTNIPDDPERPFFAKPVMHLIDTSHANVKETVNNVTTTIIPGLNGAGKHRTKAFKGVYEHIETLMNDHKPCDFNIIIFSLAGGSGSVIAPLLASAILSRNKPVICLAIGSTTSGIEVDNTLKTLQTLQGMANSGKTGGKAIPLVYLENATGTISDADDNYKGTRVDNDLKMEAIIRQLGLLFSGGHLELDQTDLANWLDYSKTSPDIPPQLTEVLIFKDDEGVNSHRGVTISTASLLASDNDMVPMLDQPYSCVGYYNEHVLNNTNPDDPIPNQHFIMTAARMPEIFRALEETASAYRETRSALSSNELSGVTSASDDESGMIL